MDLQQHAGMIVCKPVSTPLAPITNISAHDGELLGKEDSTKYRNIVEALQYLTLTCLDIAYSVKKVCQYLHAPRIAHMFAVK
jgi:hypothetical protein